MSTQPDTLWDQKRFFCHDGQSIAYLEAGDRSKPLILIVHGWISHGGTFKTTIDALSDQYHVAAIDLLGHGHSSKPVKGDYSIDAQAGRVAALADHLGVKRFSVIGHSMGGQIATYLALYYPRRIERIISISGVINGRLSDYVRKFIAPIFYMGAMFPAVWEFSRALRDVDAYRALYDRPIYLNYRAFPGSTVDHRMALIEGIEVPAWRDLEAIAAVDMTSELHRLRIPVGVIFGAQDGCVPIVNGHLMEQHIPTARMITIDQCGHVPMAEQPEQYLEAVKELLTFVPERT